MPTTAIVTGHTSGLGRALTTRLLNHGWTVIGVSRSSTFGSHAEPGHLYEVTGSVDQSTTVTAAFDLARSHGNLTLVINCAGQGCFGEIGTYSAEDIQLAISGNLSGLILFSDVATRNMPNGGSIVNVMSTAAKKLRPAESVYTAVKWGAKAYTRTLREAIKAKKLPIRVIEVYPCGMRTAFWQKAIRTITNGETFPSPEPIADSIVRALLETNDSYPLELTFERT